MTKEVCIPVNTVMSLCINYLILNDHFQMEFFGKKKKVMEKIIQILLAV